MTTTSRLIILGIFLAGTALGYLDILPRGTGPAANSAASDMPAATGRAPGFQSSQDNITASLPLPSEKNMNMLLKRYADFSLQETRDELDRLLKIFKENKKDFDSHLHGAISYLALKLGSLSPEDARQWLQDKKTVLHQNFYSAFLEGWAQKDFQGAMEYLLAHKKESNYSAHTFFILSEQLAQKDPGKALKWLATLTPGERVSALQAMLEAFPLNHPEKMPEFLSFMDDKELNASNSSQIYGKLAKAWATTDWESAKAWIDTLKGRKKGEALSQALAGLSKTDMPRATEELKKADKAQRDSIGSAILQNFSSDDQAQGKTLDWLMENKDQFTNPEFVVHSCVFSSSHMTPELTSKVLQLPDEKIKDAALQTMVSMKSSMAAGGYDYDDDSREIAFQKVLDLAARITDDKTRSRSIKSSINDWIRESPAEARQWLTEKSSLPDKEKQELLQNCDARQKEQTKQKS